MRCLAANENPHECDIGRLLQVLRTQQGSSAISWHAVGDQQNDLRGLLGATANATRATLWLPFESGRGGEVLQRPARAGVHIRATPAAAECPVHEGRAVELRHPPRQLAEGREIPAEPELELVARGELAEACPEVREGRVQPRGHVAGEVQGQRPVVGLHGAARVQEEERVQRQLACDVHGAAHHSYGLQEKEDTWWKYGSCSCQCH
mmetsp:Transcript_25527/g.73326  ORF Transcript_25527/g.73326 Transcript_25527/m.73326 type:complete len:207 (-) Transcript_25527:77-697(-)